MQARGRLGSERALGVIMPFLRATMLLCAAGIGLVSSDPACAQAPTSPPPAAIEVTLPESVFIGLRGNIAIRSAYLQRVVQKFNLKVAEAAFEPVVAASSSLTRSLSQSRDGNGSRATKFDFEPAVSLATITGAQFGFSWDNNASFNYSGGSPPTTRSANSTPLLTVVQPLLAGGGIEVATAPLRLAEITEKTNVLSLRDSVSGTILGIIQAYRSYVQAQAQTTIAETALKQARDLVAVNEALIQARRMATEDLVQTQANVAVQELSFVQAQSSEDAARQALLVALGLSPSTRIKTAGDSLAANQVKIDLLQALDIAFANRPDYLEQLLALESTKINLVVAKNARLWNLSLNGSVGRAASDLPLPKTFDEVPSNRSKTNSSIGLALTVPILNGAALTNEAGEVSAKVAVDQAELTLQNLRLTIQQTVRNDVRNVDLGWRQLEIARRSRELSQRQLENERAKLRVGRSTNFQVVSYEIDLTNAQISELGAVIGYLNALTTLDADLGTTLDTWKIQLNP